MLLFSIEGSIRAMLLLGVFAVIVVFGEYLRRSQTIIGEGARKFVHAVSGTWAALWPAFLDLRSIAVLAFILSTAALILRQFKAFQSIYSIRRLSLGEVLIGIGLGFSALLSENGAVFASAVLIISWSDSLAAVIGIRYGRKNSFKVLGAKKSVAGSVAFFLSTIVILMSSLYYKFGMATISSASHLIGSLALTGFIAICLTVVEITGIYGIDNLTIPIFATVVLNSLLQ